MLAALHVLQVCLVAELFSELLCARFGQAVLRALPLIAKGEGDGKVCVLMCM